MNLLQQKQHWKKKTTNSSAIEASTAESEQVQNRRGRRNRLWRAEFPLRRHLREERRVLGLLVHTVCCEECVVCNTSHSAPSVTYKEYSFILEVAVAFWCNCSGVRGHHRWSGVQQHRSRPSRMLNPVEALSSLSGASQPAIRLILSVLAGELRLRLTKGSAPTVSIKDAIKANVK